MSSFYLSLTRARFSLSLSLVKARAGFVIVVVIARESASPSHLRRPDFCVCIPQRPKAPAKDVVLCRFLEKQALRRREMSRLFIILISSEYFFKIEGRGPQGGNHEQRSEPPAFDRASRGLATLSDCATLIFSLLFSSALSIARFSLSLLRESRGCVAKRRAPGSFMCVPLDFL